jgi:hypothetical protein
MEAILSSEKVVAIYQIIGRYNPEDNLLIVTTERSSNPTKIR